MPAPGLASWSHFPGARRTFPRWGRAGTWFGEPPDQPQPCINRFIGVETMSTTPVASQLAPAVRRVRHQARDVVLLMAFSAGTSLGIAALMLLLVHVGG